MLQISLNWGLQCFSVQIGHIFYSHLIVTMLWFFKCARPQISDSSEPWAPHPKHQKCSGVQSSKYRTNEWINREKESLILIELEFRDFGFCGGRKIGQPWENTTTNKKKLNPHMALGRNWTRVWHWWKMSSHHYPTPAPQWLFFENFLKNLAWIFQFRCC